MESAPKTLTPAAPPPAPAPAPSAPEPAVPGGGDPAGRSNPSASAAASARVYTADDTDVLKPVPVVRSLPAWNPANPVDAKREFRGVLELTIDEKGRITQATIRKTVNPTYDAALLRAVERWSFKPATKDGAPVKYLYSLDIHLGVIAR